MFSFFVNQKKNYKETNENLRFVLDLQLKIHLH